MLIKLGKSNQIEFNPAIYQKGFFQQTGSGIIAMVQMADVLYCVQLNTVQKSGLQLVYIVERSNLTADKDGFFMALDTMTGKYIFHSFGNEFKPTPKEMDNMNEFSEMIADLIKLHESL